MSPVHIDELNPKTRARVLAQISGTEGTTTALAVVEPQTHPSCTPAEMRARSILSRIDSISAKLKTLETDIRILWQDFDNLKVGETILGCHTKKEFCEKKLHRTPQAIRYMLNPELRSKHCLPPAPEPIDVAKEHLRLMQARVNTLADASNYPERAEQRDAIVKTLQVYRNAFREIRSDAINTELKIANALAAEFIARPEIPDPFAKPVKPPKPAQQPNAPVPEPQPAQPAEPKPQPAPVECSPADAIEAITAFIDKRVRNMAAQDALAVYQQLVEELKARIAVENI
jgi:hypothetical protein